MKYYLISGEASGDLHGSNLMKAILTCDPQADFRFWGGDRMQNVGGVLVKHYRDLAFMGVWEVLTHLKTILKNIRFCKEDILAYQPDAIIFIDYPGFNLRIAKWAKKQGFITHFYVAPQIWAWKENRIKTIRKAIDFLYVILPFEKDFFEKKHQFPVHFVGHPLLDALQNHEKVNADDFNQKYQLDSRPIIALLPGSRKQEIRKILPEMLSVIPYFTDYQFVIAGAPSLPFSFYQTFLSDADIKFIDNDTYNLLSNARAALVASGTATLETALLKVPLVVCYKTSSFTYEIAKRIIKLKYISLVNLIMDKEVVTELIQNDLNPDILTQELRKILSSPYREEILHNYDLLVKMLGNEGASDRIAQKIVSFTKAKLKIQT